MTQEEYNLLDADFAHCPGKQSGRAKNAYATPLTRCSRRTHEIVI